MSQIPEQFAKAIQELYHGLKKLGEEVDSLQIQMKRFGRPWYLEGAVIVAAMALAFSIGSAYFSYVLTERQRIHQIKTQLNSQINKLMDYEFRLLEIGNKYKDQPEFRHSLRKSRNAERASDARMASKLAKSIDEEVNAQEHILIARALSYSQLVNDAKWHLLKALDKAEDIFERSQVFNRLAILSFETFKYEEGRIYFSRSIIDLGDESDKYKKASIVYRNAASYLQWAFNEDSRGNCEQFSKTMSKAFENADKIPSTHKHYFTNEFTAASYLRITCKDSIPEKATNWVKRNTLPRPPQTSLAPKDPPSSSNSPEQTKEITSVRQCPLPVSGSQDTIVTGSIADKTSGDFEGIFEGQIQEGNNLIDVQTKLVRKNNKVVGAYFRQNVCGTMEGYVKDSKVEFSWEWAGNNGLGIAAQQGDTLHASLKNIQSPGKIMQLKLQRIAESTTVVE